MCDFGLLRACLGHALRICSPASAASLVGTGDDRESVPADSNAKDYVIAAGKRGA